MLELIVWNVQHGSAVYINTPDGKHIAVDLGAGGNNGSVFSPLQRCATRMGFDNSMQW